MAETNQRRYIAFYDDQCEICQAFVSWLYLLDRRGRVDCQPIEPERLRKADPRLRVEDCSESLHVLTPDGKISVGWYAVATLARLSVFTWIVGALGVVPPFSWFGRTGYSYVAANRYALSKCRGGACRVAQPRVVRKRARFHAFWSCRLVGILLRLPLIIAAFVRDLAHRAVTFAMTFGRRYEFLGGKLQILVLNGFPTGLVPLLFGELFVTILYDGVAIDPGSPRMRKSLRRHLRSVPAGAIKAVAATHHHEEHTGNVNWLATKLGATLYVGAETASRLQPPARLPFARRLIIGQTPPLTPPFELLAERLQTASGTLEVLGVPGHCDDELVFYDPEEKLLLAGDAFMGTYFSTPNPDVDSRAWIRSLERILELNIEILIEGHGHVHTLRPDIPDIPAIVKRQEPKRLLAEKLSHLRWLDQQIRAGLAEGLSVRAVEASCFPWRRRSNWESFASDQMTRVLSLGHFSRSEVVRSFVRTRRTVFPTVFEVSFHRED